MSSCSQDPKEMMKSLTLCNNYQLNSERVLAKKDLIFKVMNETYPADMQRDVDMSEPNGTDDYAQLDEEVRMQTRNELMAQAYAARDSMKRAFQEITKLDNDMSHRNAMMFTVGLSPGSHEKFVGHFSFKTGALTPAASETMRIVADLVEPAALVPEILKKTVKSQEKSFKRQKLEHKNQQV